MADARAAGCAGETTIGNQGDFAIKTFVVNNRVCGHEHLRCSRTFSPFITDKNDITRFDVVMNNGLLGILFRIENARRAGMVVHLWRAGGIFNDCAFWCDITF
ncbi:hypothetical protein SDC9_180462 [bioreactor metagenome]|uniref:Uncharacterized protein n=1 Tax=bioreactor metagenome TaxID=1076179 RepID=A0A645H4N3_9ZZZZ